MPRAPSSNAAVPIAATRYVTSIRARSRWRTRSTRPSATAAWQDTEINIIDTPGFTDFLPRAVAVLPAVECAALVLSASGGLETGVRRMMKAAGDAELGRLIIVNKMDTDPDKLDVLLAEIQEAFGGRCLPGKPAERPRPQGRGLLFPRQRRGHGFLERRGGAYENHRPGRRGRRG
jgi:hypothetical protein